MSIDMCACISLDLLQVSLAAKTGEGIKAIKENNFILSNNLGTIISKESFYFISI